MTAATAAAAAQTTALALTACLLDVAQILCSNVLLVEQAAGRVSRAVLANGSSGRQSIYALYVYTALCFHCMHVKEHAWLLSLAGPWRLLERQAAKPETVCACISLFRNHSSAVQSTACSDLKFKQTVADH